jgi:hypothetical protein
VSKKNKGIKKPHLILCEGEDATQYIIWLLDFFINIEGDKEFEDFLAFDFGGIDDLSNFLSVLKNLANYETVRSITIVRDAEGNAQSAVENITRALGNNGFSYASNVNTVSKGGQPKTGFVLFPSCSGELESGTLENLCLRTLSDVNSGKILSAVDSVVKNFDFKRPHKNRLHTYFSLTDKFVALKIGEAAHARAFNFHCPEIESLKLFLSQMLSCSDTIEKSDEAL